MKIYLDSFGESIIRRVFVFFAFWTVSRFDEVLFYHAGFVFFWRNRFWAFLKQAYFNPCGENDQLFVHFNVAENG